MNPEYIEPTPDDSWITTCLELLETKQVTAAELAMILQGLSDRPDPAHRCCVCQRNYVDSDSGYDTCVYCLRNV